LAEGAPKRQCPTEGGPEEGSFSSSRIRNGNGLQVSRMLVEKIELVASALRASSAFRRRTGGTWTFSEPQYRPNGKEAEGGLAGVYNSSNPMGIPMNELKGIRGHRILVAGEHSKGHAAGEQALKKKLEGRQKHPSP